MTATLPHPSIAPAGKPVNRELQTFRDGLVRFTWDDALQLMRIGVIPEDSTIELLDGLLVHRDCGDSKGRPGVAGIAHDFAVRMIGKLDRRVDSVDCHLVTQITLLLDSEYCPVPDALILRGPPGDYRTRQPTAADVLCAIEVADISFDRDAGEKLTAYASAGIGQYVIINLRNRNAEVYTRPDTTAGTFAPPEIVPDGGSLSLPAGSAGVFITPLAGLLP